MCRFLTSVLNTLPFRAIYYNHIKNPGRRFALPQAMCFWAFSPNFKITEFPNYRISELPNFRILNS